MLKLIGYWNKLGKYSNRNHLASLLPIQYRESYLNSLKLNDSIIPEKYIDPSKLIDKDFWMKYNKSETILYLKNGTPIKWYRGFSSCRICGKILGVHERTDGVWYWPDQFEHYIENHDIRIPEDFLNNLSKVKFNTEKRQLELDESYWQNWCQEQINKDIK